METGKTALANKINYTLIWYVIYNIRPANRAGTILTAPEHTQGLNSLRIQCYQHIWPTKD